MKIITKFVADDGTEFPEEAKAEAHDKLIKRVELVMRPMGKIIEDYNCDFSNGSGYIQHDISTVFDVRVALLEIANSIYHHKWLLDAKSHPSWAGRIISECCPNVVYGAWPRICCVDVKGREWGQPFFALNPDKGTQKCLKDNR